LERDGAQTVWRLNRSVAEGETGYFGYHGLAHGALLGGKMSDSTCLFCKIIAGEIPSKKVFENEEFLAFADINPQAPVHILIVPKEHISTVAEVSAEKSALLGRLIAVANHLAVEKQLDSGYRLVINCRADGGQEVYHLHLHLLGGRKFTWPPG